MKNMFFGERKKCKALKLHPRIFAAISSRQMVLLWFSTQPRTAPHKHPTQSSLKMKNVDTRRPHQLIVASNARQSSIPQGLANRVLIDIQFTLINNSVQSRKAIPLDPEFFNQKSMTKLRYFTKSSTRAPTRLKRSVYVALFAMPFHSIRLSFGAFFVLWISWHKKISRSGSKSHRNKSTLDRKQFLFLSLMSSFICFYWINNQCFCVSIASIIALQLRFIFVCFCRRTDAETKAGHNVKRRERRRS